LLQRISTSRSTRELQQLFDRQQQRMRPHHLAALIARLPDTNEGRTAVDDLAAAAAAVESAALSRGTAAVVGFADDLATMLQLQLGALRAEQQLGVVQVGD
jgi:hypothetical protein